MTNQSQKLETCSFHKYGHCKLGDECDKYHSKKVCSIINCDVKSCNDRHPRPCAFFSLKVCKFPKDCSFSHKKVEDINSLRKDLSDMKCKYGSVIRTVEKQDKIINILRDQVNTLQGEVLNMMKNMSDFEIECNETGKPLHQELKSQGNVEDVMDVDGENLKASQNISSLREVTWDEGEDEGYKELLLFEKDIAEKVRDELKDVNKNLKKRSLDETKGRMGKLGVWVKEKGIEVENMAGKDLNHKDKFEHDKDFKEMLTEMSNVTSAMELSTKKEKTRKILEDNIKNLIEGADIVRTSKCMEIWALFDEMHQ